MARGRMIDKRISMSKKIGGISDKSKILYFMIYPHLDQEGRVAFDDLDDLKVEILPYFKNWSTKNIGEALNELADIKLIILYPANGKIAMQFNRFEDFQVGLRKDREAKSEIIAPGEAPATAGSFRILPSLSLSLSIRKEGRKEVILFSFEVEEWQNITDQDIKGWEEAYPACEIKAELKKMGQWLLSNPDKKKKNYRRFITNWLSRTQDKGGTIKSTRSMGSKITPGMDEWAEKKEDKE